MKHTASKIITTTIKNMELGDINITQVNGWEINGDLYITRQYDTFYYNIIEFKDKNLFNPRIYLVKVIGEYSDISNTITKWLQRYKIPLGNTPLKVYSKNENVEEKFKKLKTKI